MPDMKKERAAALSPIYAGTVVYALIIPEKERERKWNSQNPIPPY